MEINIFNTRFSVEKVDTPQSIEKNYKREATKKAREALLEATLNYQHNKLLLERAEQYNLKEDMVKSLETAVESYQRGMNSAQTQLDILTK